MELRLQSDDGMHRLLAILIAVLSLACTAVAATTRAIVLDERAFRFIDLGSGRASDPVALPRGEQRLVYSPDLTRLAVFSIPEDKSRRATATFFDALTLERTAATDLGWGINDVLAHDDDTLYVLTRGVRSENPGKRRAAELLELDFSGAVRRRLSFDRDADEMNLAPDGKTAVVFMAGDAKKSIPAEYRFVDRQTLEQTTVVKLTPEAGAPLAFYGSTNFYSIDPGDRRSGLLYVFSTTPPALAATVQIGAGGKIAAIQPELNRLFVLSRNGEAESFADVIRNGTVEKRATLDFEPIYFDFAKDGRSATIIGRSIRGVMGVHAMRRAPFELPESDAGTAAPRRVDNAISLEEGEEIAGRALLRAVEAMEHASKLAAMLGTAATITHGPRTGGVVHAGTTIGAVAAALLTRDRAPAFISEPATYTDYYRRVPDHLADQGPRLVSADGQTEYEVIGTNLFIHASEGRGGRIEAGEGRKELVPLGDEQTLAVVANDRVTLFDLQKQQKPRIVEAEEDVLGFAVSADSRFAAVIDEEEVRFIDGSNRTATVRVRDLHGRIEVVFVD